MRTHVHRKEPQTKWAFLREQLLLAAALLWWECNKASVSVQQIKTNRSPPPIEFHYVPKVIKSAFWAGLLRMLKTLQHSTVVIRSLMAGALYREWNQSLPFPKGRASAADQWGAGGVLKPWWTPRSSVLQCAQETAQRQSWDCWLLSAPSQPASSSTCCVLLTLSLLIPTAIQVSSEGWGSSLKP